jgi:HEAT repeat protein
VRVLDAVIRVAGNPDEPDLVRTFAIQSLGGFDDPRALRALVDVLRDDEDPGARRLAASTLGQKGGREAVGPLIRAVSDRDSRVRTGVVRALGDIGDAGAVEPVMGVLNNRAEDSAVRMVAGLALGDLGDARAVESLRRVCMDVDEAAPVRGGAAIGWAKLQDEAALEPLLDLSADEEPTLRKLAVAALGWLGDERAVEPLIQTLESDEHADIRYYAANALDKIGDERAVEPLITALADEGLFVRRAAVLALRRFRDARSVEPLVEFLRRGDEEEALVAEVVLTLGAVGDERAIPALEWAGEYYAARSSPGFRFREAAADAIRRIRRRGQSE